MPIRRTVCQSAYSIPKRGSPAVNGDRFVENKPDGDLSVTIILRSRVSYG